MLRCKGPARGWYLQQVTGLHFHSADHKYNFNDPKWPIVYTEPDRGLTAETDDVLDLLESAGSLIQEVFGMNYFDLISMDQYTYSRFKKRVYSVYENRLKEQQEQEEEAERQRREDELQRQRDEQQRRREQHS